jgi:hypothetical protein
MVLDILAENIGTEPLFWSFILGFTILFTRFSDTKTWDEKFKSSIDKVVFCVIVGLIVYSFFYLTLFQLYRVGNILWEDSIHFL